MAPRYSDEEAIKRMLNADLKPQSKFLGVAKQWDCRCLKCNRQVSISLHSVNNGAKCPYCSGKKRIPPEEAIQAMLDHGFTPLAPFPGKVNRWRMLCATCGSECNASYVDVMNGQKGCRKCAGARISSSKRFSREEVEAYLFSIGLELVGDYIRSGTPISVKCITCSFPWAARLSALRRGLRCPKCKALTSKTQNALIRTNGRISEAEALRLVNSLGLQPLEPFPMGMRAVWRLKCMTCGYEQSRKAAALRLSKGCIACVRKKRSDLALLDSDEAERRMIERGFQPLEPYVNASTPWMSRCLKCNREISPTLNNLLNAKIGCAYCSRRRVEPEEAVAVMLAAGFVPLEAYPGASAHWRCRCSKCNTVRLQRYSLVLKGGGCRKCAGQERDLEEALAVMRASGFEPLTPYPGARKPWESTCMKCGRKGRPHFSSVLRGSSCRFCMERKVDPDIAEQLMRAADLEPLEPYVSAKTPWKCRCLKCNRIVKPQWHKIKAGHGGCKYCVVRGFRPDKPAFVYLMHHPQYKSLKIGITNQDALKQRYAAHMKNGWSLLHEISAHGEVAQSIENKVIQWWRETLGFPPHLTPELMPQAGYTETISDEAVAVEEVWKLVLAVHKSFELSGRDKRDA